ncbi:putative transcriptional regulatory protein C15D4.02 [Cladobotryum mycophilum]|uniref:Transcriptional regulatory protein C15D4.02 n=1 Tax=Cladobotryum mycophilum TaxID=491253 RepID=A0ABR0T398_9HYPO
MPELDMTAPGFKLHRQPAEIARDNSVLIRAHIHSPPGFSNLSADPSQVYTASSQALFVPSGKRYRASSSPSIIWEYDPDSTTTPNQPIYLDHFQSPIIMDSPDTPRMLTARPRLSASPPIDPKEDRIKRKLNARKRTKTGCLTCRKRRIKCDEGKPTCKNCIKSKRNCDGYSQRVIFKEPIGSMSAPFNTNAFAGSSNLGEDSMSNQQDGQVSRMALQAIAPRPPGYHINPSLHISHRQEGVPTTTEQRRQNPHSSFPLRFSEDDNAGEGPSRTAVLDNTAAFYSQPSGLSQLPHHYRAGPEPQQLASQNDNAGEGSSSTNRVGSLVAVDSNPLGSLLPPDDQDENRSLPDSVHDYQEAQSIVVPATTAELQHLSATEVRTFGAYSTSRAVSAYLDHPHAPNFWHPGLRDIFMHFINVTGPTISLYEPQAFERGEPSKEHTAGHGLWKSAFPQMALRHPALLQAMLALASLQLAKLQNYPETAALKHYHLALRRITRIMMSEMRRTHPATLAATLLLGYFEVWTADHTKWSQHLLGARILFSEIPLKAMVRRCLPIKRWRQFERQRRNINPYFPGLLPQLQPASALDYRLLSTLTGIKVTSEDYGDITPQYLDPRSLPVSDKDVENFDIYCDLFWWYCKMDVYQSFLGGTKLFMEYEYWTQCPPRAPVSKPETAFGTYDHLVLLLGRLADFSFKDRLRKHKAEKAAKARTGGAAPGSPNTFPGMLPIQGKVRVPTGFGEPRQTTPQSDSHEDVDPQVSFQAALREWESIRQAFDVFRNHLGPEFESLDAGYGDLMDTPFGSAVQYRSYAISGIWMNYYMGLINLFRSHPEMPPASLQAAGLQAAKTHNYAVEIGRIAAGVVLDLSHVAEINTLLAAALIESSFCLFVAAVQYGDSDQRKWLVRRMFDVSRLTGWQSARQIAGGCESSWIKAHEMKRGPPYTRTTLFNSQSIWDNPRRIDDRIREISQGEEEPLVLQNADRANYALGLLAVEEDLEVLKLEDR